MSGPEYIEQAIKEHLPSALFSVENRKITQRGKVRDIFAKDDHLLFVNTDRISAFDQVLGTVPLKGALLCEQAEYWFKFSKGICKNHFLDRPDPQILVCKKATTLPVEVIVRGYLAGSLMREPKHIRGKAYGLSLDPDLIDFGQFNTPIITPTTKAKIGDHDEPISAEDIVRHGLVSKKHWQEIENVALLLFTECSREALNHGLLMVDTKYEFGLINGKLHLIDELHTSDSSRFFIKIDYDEKLKTNETPTMLDKEFLRVHLMKKGVDPKTTNLSTLTLDDELRSEIGKRYFLLTEKITGRNFIPPTVGARSRVDQALLHLLVDESLQSKSPQHIALDSMSAPGQVEVG